MTIIMHALGLLTRGVDIVSGQTVAVANWTCTAELQARSRL